MQAYMSGLLSMPSGTEGGPNELRGRKLHDAAQQFESLLINEMLKSAQTEASEDSLGSGENEGPAMDMAQSQFATAIARSGGLGIAKAIESKMSATQLQKKADTAFVGAGSPPK